MHPSTKAASRAAGRDVGGKDRLGSADLLPLWSYRPVVVGNCAMFVGTGADCPDFAGERRRCWRSFAGEWETGSMGDGEIAGSGGVLCRCAELLPLGFAHLSTSLCRNKFRASAPGAHPQRVA